MTDANLLRIVLVIAGLAWLAYIAWSGRHRPPQGTRTPKRASGGERLEPSLGDTDAVANDGLDPVLRAELERLGSVIADRRVDPDDIDVDAEIPSMPVRERSNVGARPDVRIERIVTLHVAAPPGETIAGLEVVVAAEKAGLEFGDMEIFHRMIDGRPELGPVFSVASMVKPGRFDMRHINELQTPGVTFFMTLPGPLPALDAWDAMLPAAQRVAERLGAQVLDEERNALGRQTIQHIRDELRALDRKHDKNVIKRTW